MCLGIPGQIIKIVNADIKLAMVDISGVKRQVNIACIIDEAQPIESYVGDWVLVHVGFALQRIDPDEVKETLRILNALADMDEQLTTLGSNG